MVAHATPFTYNGTALVARVGLKEELSLKPAPYELTNPLVELPAYLGACAFFRLRVY